MLALLLLSVLSAAGMTQAYPGQCQTFQTPISISATNLNIELPPPQNNSQLIASTQAELTIGAGVSSLASFINGTIPVSGQYSIETTLCMPNTSSTSSTLLFLVTGLGLDKEYFNPSFGDGAYSLVEAAGQKGYATLRYNYLGVGNSSKPDGTKVVQTPALTEVARQMLYAVRNGTLPAAAGNTSFSKVVGVGIGYGSLQLVDVVSSTPAAFDGLLLTGFSHNTTGTFEFTATTQPIIAATSGRSDLTGLPSDYQIFSSQYGTTVYYLFEGGALPGFSNYTFQTLQPFTVGTELTLPPTNISAPEFKGPVFLMNGQEDLLSCAGACSGPDHDITAAEKAYFGSSSNFTSFNIPNTGLVVNYHYSASSIIFPKTFEWLSSNGF